jgi:hypothetical protein
MHNENKKVSEYLRHTPVWSTDGKWSHIQTCRRYAQPPRLAFSPVLVQPSHSARYNQESAADPQLYVAITSHSKRRIRSTNQDMMFLLPSEKRNPTTICHSHARAYLIKFKNSNSTAICQIQDRAYLSALWTDVKVSCEPPGVDARRLFVLPVCGNIRGGGGQMPIAAPT